MTGMLNHWSHILPWHGALIHVLNFMWCLQQVTCPKQWSFHCLLQKQIDLSFINISHANCHCLSCSSTSISLQWSHHLSCYSILPVPLASHNQGLSISLYFCKKYYLSILVGCHAGGSDPNIDNNFCGIRAIFIHFYWCQCHHNTGFNCPHSCHWHEIDIGEQSSKYEHQVRCHRSGSTPHVGHHSGQGFVFKLYQT